MHGGEGSRSGPFSVPVEFDEGEVRRIARGSKLFLLSPGDAVEEPASMDDTVLAKPIGYDKPLSSTHDDLHNKHYTVLALDCQVERPIKSMMVSPPKTKYCPSCEVDLPLERFNKNRARPDGLQNYCKTCASLAVQMSKRNSKKNQAHDSKLKRLTLYGLTPEDYERMLFEQNNQCPICWMEMGQPQIDYDPGTGELRGLLCSDCRSGLTLFKNDLELIYRLSSYLESFKTDNTPE